MPKAYEPAPPTVKARANALIERHAALHDLWKCELKIDYLYATNDTGDAVSHRGYPALAVVRIVNLKDRTKGMGDAEITIDAAKYMKMTERQQDALLHHELHHLIIVSDEEGHVKLDDQGRPKLKMRKHDYDFGLFTDIAEIYGMDSPEVTNMKIMWDNAHQALFPFLEDCRTIEAEVIPGLRPPNTPAALLAAADKATASKERKSKKK